MADRPIRKCNLCDDTGYKDYAGFAMDPCDHLQFTPAAEKADVVEAQDKRRTALIERISTIADLASEKPLQGELGDVAYDLLRQAAAQMSSDRLRIAALQSGTAKITSGAASQARTTALEEAALLADERASRLVHSALSGWTVTHARRNEANIIASAIRALAKGGSGDSTSKN